jgi:hypothetical protein
MAAPHQTHGPYPDEGTGFPPRRRVRLAVWDLICTVAVWVVVFIVATTTSWPSQLFGFVADVCAGDSCPPVPFGIDLWIYPVVWGGLGAAVAAAVIGPCVSIVKGWYLFFWPILAVAIVILSAAAGATMTAFSEHYWH